MGILFKHFECGFFVNLNYIEFIIKCLCLPQFLSFYYFSLSKFLLTMGKQQRRKDNSQAASSSKAAQLVHANGVGVPFIGLESSGLGLLDVGQDTPNEFVDLAPEFRILLKKLTKRDSLTREKAVREFAELLKNATSDQLKLSFEYFAPIYQRLVTDANSAIRSASNKLLAEHISRLMKETPNNCLKQTLPFLLFSTADHSKQVVKSATSLLNDCFVAEKKDLVFKNFADDALSLSLNVVNRRHRLFLAPQLFTDEESIEQRRDRLVAQSFNCIDKFAALSSDLPSLLSTLSATFTNSESLNPLIALGNNVKVSLFRLAKKIAQRDPYLLIKGKFITVLLNNLNLSDSSLFQHAFECFLRLAQEDALFEQYSLDKAIVPKLLSLIRKKEGHWDLLADSLLPAFSLIFDRIGPADRKKQCKFAFSVLDSFFDDSVLTIRISPWSNAFVEISKFSLLKLLFDVESENEDEKMEIVTQFFLRVTKFADFVVNDLPVTEYAKLAEFVGWLRQNLTVRTEHSKSVAFALDLYSNLEQHLLSLLPKTDFFFVKLLDSTQENGKLAFKLLISSNSSSISNTLLIKAAEALLSSPQANPSEFDALLDIVVLRIRMGYDSVDFDSEIGRLINLLCRILMRTNKSPNSLAQQIKMDNIWICLHSVGFVLSDFCDLLDHNSIFTAFCTIFQSLKRLESKFEQVKHTLELALAYICEKCSDSEREHLLNILPSEAQQIVLMPNTVNFIFAYLVKRRKISVGLQHFFAENIFKTSLETPEFISSSAFLILRQFECDAPKMRRLLRQFLSSKDCTISQIELASNSCNAIAYFTNTTLSELFAPIRSDFIQMAQQMDCLFSAEVLSDDQCLSTVFSLLCANNSPIQLGGNSSSSQNPNDCLLKFAKSALFYCKFLQNASETDRRVVDTSFCYVLVVSTFVNHFKLRTTKMDQSQMLLLFSKEFDTILSIFPSEPSFDQIANAFLNLSQHENECYFSFCAFYSLFKFALLNQQSWQNPFERSPIQTIFEIAFQMRSNANSDVDSVLDLLPHQSAKNAETFAVLRWLTEFEWRCANLTEENRAEHFVALATFIDQHRKEVEDWLFTVRNDKMIQSLFGCVVLKFCAQIVPFLAEVGGPIRDFVNCALITALQNCTESIFTFYDKSKAFDDASMHWMMGHFALILAVRYENCVRMNGANEDYRDIAREWLEFFGPSVANYVFYWFLQFFYINESEKVPPQFFSKSLCNAIQSIDSDRLIKAEIPLEFVQRVTDQCNYDNFPIGQFFEGYSNEKLSKLAPTAVLFFNSNPEIQFAAATILKGFLFEMFSSENTNSSGFGKKSSNCSESEKGADEEDTEGIGQSLARESRQLELPRFFKAVLHFELDNFSRLNESEVDPLLLSWDVLMRFFADLDVLSRVRFCDAIDVKTLSNSLAHLFNSLSDPPGLKVVPLGAVPRVDDLFVGHFHYKLIDRPFDREHFVSNLFFRTLAVIPALFREWHGSLNKTEAKAVNDYTQKYVSHLLIRRELRSLENMKRGRLEIRILSKVREIECTYRLEETEMNLTILLPENYPIRAPKVETGRSIVSKELHRKWLLQLGVFLNGQNGVMLDGILQWKRSIDNHLQGVEECTICMSTVSSTNFQLPKIRCRQCRKKFHGDCLYKWFQSSSKSSCPLCRANFV